MDEIKFTLDEAFDIFYAQLLEEKNREDISTLVEDIDNSSADMLEALDLLEFTQRGEVAGTNNNSNDNDNNNNGHDHGDKKTSDPGKSADAYASAYGNLVDKINHDILDNIKVSVSSKDDDGGVHYSPSRRDTNSSFYKPAVGYEVTEKIGDMKFPNNIIFFIKSLVTWIKNNILNFIDKCSNIIRGLLGLSVGRDRFSADDLKLKLAKSKQIENHYLVNTQKDAYQQVNKTATMIGDAPAEYQASIKPVMMMDVNSKDVSPLFGIREETGEKYVKEAGLLPLTESAALFEAPQGGDERTPIVRLDTTQDLMALRESLNHFFDLYDNAYGSNNEDMFSTVDIQLELALFKDSLDRIEHPSTVNAVKVGNAIDYDGVSVSSQKLRDNLLRTKVNTDNLKSAYTITNQQINAIAKIIANKNLVGITQMGVQYAMLSASTYEIMIDMVGDIDSRIKQAAKTEKDLQKMKDSFSKLADELDRRRTIISAGSTITYTTALERQISDMYDGARYMTQTVQLRLDALALYLSELNDTRAILKNLNAINTVNFPTFKSWRSGVGQKIKNLFSHGPEFTH